jgi:hypothetical protein
VSFIDLLDWIVVHGLMLIAAFTFAVMALLFIGNAWTTLLGSIPAWMPVGMIPYISSPKPSRSTPDREMKYRRWAGPLNDAVHAGAQMRQEQTVLSSPHQSDMR